jgi:RNA polymerase sigma-70 factor, ECF subfamily
VDYTTLDDESLLGLIMHARTDALGALYDRYGRLVFSLALSSVGDPATAEEITQDVFLHVWQRAGQYRRERGKVSTWLTAIARHRSIDQLRRDGARPPRAAAWVEASPEADVVGGTTNGPEQSAALAMEREQVHRALASLPDEQKHVLALAYFAGLSQSQIATALNLPLGTVKTRIRLAMQKLRRMLGGDWTRSG